ncbi:hypothetical protein GO495_15515 [Chitinophaga oryziterrae]|uniref:RHS repeat protein n=1 Tax=Chitinophaga oryziterrae TaxID=1031224 RepID=A0A6N8JCL1_9BACT|nr:RHS repeat domain-containing protein [Chitinophaga oryziterrae]MVT41999.1 hypothetical protein [Chitinophaga oryziterrae]
MPVFYEFLHPEEQYQLPPRKNFGIDTWGYYNGKNTNQHLLALNEFGRQYSFVDVNGMSSVSNVQNPADRTVNEDYMKAGMLKRIYYPTGGYSDFEFEANRISTSKTIEKPGTTIFVAAKKDDPAGDTTRVSVFISPVTVSTTATIPATLTLNLPLWSDIKKPEIIFQNLTKGTFERYRTYPGDATFRTVNIALYEGDQYKISSSIYPNPNDPNDDTDEDVLATVKWPSGQTQVINVVQKGPGLRIKSIKSYEITGNLAKQEDYRYGTNESGFGKISFFDYLFTANTYVQNYVYCIPDANSPQLISYPYAVNKLEILSKPIFNYSDFGGSSIFYPEVSKYQISTGGDNGKTVYNYDYELDDKVESTYPEPQLLVSADWKSGNLLSEKAYKRKTDNTYQLISETINEYGLFMIDTVFGLKVRQNTIYYGGGTCMPSRTATHTRATLDKDFKFFEYPVFSGVKKVINSTSKIYSEDNSALTNKTTYTYNNYSHLLPNITTYINSKGEIVKKADRYPHDKALIAGITPAESAAIDSMIARNMVETMIEREETINDTPVNKSHMEFGMWGAFVALKKYKLQKGNNSMFDKFEIFNYDTHGNILEQSNGNNAHEVYLWGYNSSYPVARVQNSTYSMVSGIVNSSIIQQPLTTDALQNELSKLYNVQLLPNCLVNTFSYEPLLGLTTMKDAGGKTMYYEYDSFGRLKTVRDPDGKVVKFYDYQYQQALNK